MKDPEQESLGHGDVLGVGVLVAQGERRWRVPGARLDTARGAASLLASMVLGVMRLTALQLSLRHSGWSHLTN